MAESKQYLMVASIDFGTAYSGYAFSFRGKETDIKLNKNWGSTEGFLSFKVPTCVLLDANGDFEAFGYEAEQKYIEALEEYEDESFTGPRKQLFRNFKMFLHTEKKVTASSKVLSVGKQEASALDIFTHCLKYMKSHLMTALSKQLAVPPEDDLIRWVITVPAIWTEESKHFMRQAAFQAGLISNNTSKKLIIALEPEAASFYCRQLELSQLSEKETISFPSGINYLVLDCGGGTNDMVAHTIVDNNKIKELFAVNGGSLGGNKVNDAFIKLLKELLGPGFIDSFQRECPEQWFNFMLRFERSKKMTADDGDTRLKVEIPSEMKELYERQRGEDEKTLKERLSLKQMGIRFVSGNLVLSHAIVKGLFCDTVAQIVTEVKKLLADKSHLQFNYIFMVGGFSESSFLQKAVKEAFETSTCKVLIPQEADLAIIKGAVLYGHFQEDIITRISRRTYGTRCKGEFIEGVHDDNRLFVEAPGVRLCLDIFKSLIEINEEVAVGTSIIRSFWLSPRQEKVYFPLFSMNRRPNELEYYDHPDLVKLGQIILEAPIDGWAEKREVDLKVTFGSTELHFEAIDNQTGNAMKTTLDFLAE